MYVWAVNAAHAPSYWFRRQCPRAMAWATPGTTDADRHRIPGPHTTRVHMVEYAWLRRIQTAQIFAYRFDAPSSRLTATIWILTRSSLGIRCVR